MGTFGFGEIFLILIVGYLVLGPEKLPKVLKKVGRSLGDFLKIRDDITKSVYDVTDSVNDAVGMNNKNINNQNKKAKENNNV